MRYLFFLLLGLSTTGFAQWKTYSISVNGDTLNRTDMKGRQQGPWVIKVEPVRGERGYEEQGFFLNGQRTGKWTRFSLQGDVIAIENYRWGQKDGRAVYLNNAGDPVREESWRAVNPDNPYDTVNIYDINDPSLVVRREVVKLEGQSLKHGTWKYYDTFSGKLEATERWEFDKLKTVPDGDDDLAPIAVSATAGSNKKEVDKKAIPKPKQVVEFDKLKKGKKKIVVRDGSTGG
jgi:antitoxin component YwqK of YwqJK toxin-antitoxin module